ncbi:MAG: putative transcriptional regulator [Herbinix sp.]|nr:putative transcriptional regulator [Herbinix sp.]
MKIRASSRKKNHEVCPLEVGMNNITDAEWKIMKVLWRRSPRLGSEIVDELETETGWNPKTIHTLIRRLVTKGVLEAKRENQYYLYSAAVTEAQCVREETNTFLDKCFNGSFNMLLSNFIEDDKLTDQEIEELENLLKAKKNR